MTYILIDLHFFDLFLIRSIRTDLWFPIVSHLYVILLSMCTFDQNSLKYQKFFTKIPAVYLNVVIDDAMDSTSIKETLIQQVS